MDSEKHRMIKLAGIINENTSDGNSFEQYLKDIKQELIKLDSGETILHVINGVANEKYNHMRDGFMLYFEDNYKKQIPAETTASHTRDKWYGV